MIVEIPDLGTIIHLSEKATRLTRLPDMLDMWPWILDEKTFNILTSRHILFV